MFSLLTYAKKYRKQIILGPFFKFLEAFFELLLPIYMARLIDQGVLKNDRGAVWQNAGIMLLLTLVGLVCVLICQYYSSIASQGFGTELRNTLLKKINTFSYPELDHFGTSTLVTRMTSDINQLQLMLAMLIRLVVRAPFLSIGSIVMAFIIDPLIAWIFVIVLPIFCLILYLIMTKTVPLYKKVQQKIDRFNQLLGENLSGVRVIRAFARKQSEAKKIDEQSDDLAKAYTRVANISALLTPATTLVLNIAIITLLYLGGVSVDTGRLQPGQILALINYLSQMLLALIVLSNLVVVFTRAAASGTRVQTILNTPVASKDQHQSKIAIKENDSFLSCRHVSFRYQENSGLVLENIDFSIQPKTVLGIIGPTGSGKSTLIQLIARFYPLSAEEGTIQLLGNDIQAYPLSQLRDFIAMAPQKSVLFTGTIRENLQWGKEDATDEDCWQALKTAQALDFVKSLPNQLDTPVLAGGKNFSGGQRQRLTIARALIKRPKLLILDDSLSALDYQTDLQLRQALKQDLKDSTCIIISQRISSVQHAEKILVLDDGKQDGFGSHEELLQQSPVYQEIFYSQQAVEELEEEAFQ